MRIKKFLITVFLISTFLLIYTSKLLLAVPTPEILWQFDTDDSAYGVSAAGDIDGDNILEVIVPSSYNPIVTCFGFER